MTKIIHRGVGSVRLRVTFTGPGGHSWTDWGTPNPLHHLSRAASAIASLPLPEDPKTTLTVARMGGGKSINSIPEEAWADLDLRSEDAGVLARLEVEVTRICQARSGTALPGETDGARGLRITIQDLGRRPAGETDPGGPLVQAAVQATEFLGTKPELVSSSTDSNVPMALGIPSITLGAGGESGGVHTSEEWYRNVRGPEGILRALLTILLARPGRGQGATTE
jgi:acetylornithine deacetylase/succinyl-diaminopimelate desuccinylase-like protein